MKFFTHPSYRVLAIGILAAMLSITACQKVEQKTSPLPTPSETSHLQSPISPTNTLTTTPLSVPTPASDRAVIIGKLVPIESGQQLILAGNLYLGTLLKSTSSDAPPIVSLTRGDNPKATIDLATNSFLFTDVIPGTYALIKDGITQSYVVQNPSGGFLQIVAEAGKVTDLGDVPVR